MIRSTQTDPNEIQLDDILEDEKMEVQTTQEDNNLAPLEVVEKRATVAPQARKEEEKLEPTMQTRVEGVGGQAKGTTFPTTTSD